MASKDKPANGATPPDPTESGPSAAKRATPQTPVAGGKKARVLLIDRRYDVMGRVEPGPEASIRMVNFVRNYRHGIAIKTGTSMFPNASSCESPRRDTDDDTEEDPAAEMFDESLKKHIEEPLPAPVPQSNDPPSRKLDYMIVTRKHKPVKLSVQLTSFDKSLEKLQSKLSADKPLEKKTMPANTPPAVQAELVRLRTDNTTLRTEVNSLRRTVASLQRRSTFEADLKKLLAEYNSLKAHYEDLVSLVKDDPKYKDFV